MYMPILVLLSTFEVFSHYPSPLTVGPCLAGSQLGYMSCLCSPWVDDILEVLTKARWQWAGHVARMKDNRWTIRCTEWQVRNGRRARGRPRRRWRDDLQQWQGATWSRTAKDRQQWRGLAEGYLRHWREHPRWQGDKVTRCEGFQIYFIFSNL